MPAPKVRADHDQLSRLATQFARQASETNKSLRQIKRQVDTLQGGDWVGKGATAFYREMDQQVLPALTRLGKSFDAAQKVTAQISKIMKQAEEDVARILGVIAAGGAAASADGAAAASGSIGADGAGGTVAGADSGSPNWLKNALKGIGVGGMTLTGLGALASNAANRLTKTAANARNLMASVFALGGENALAKTGISKIVAQYTSDAAKAFRTADWIKKGSTGLSALGAGFTGLNQGLESSAETWLGKLTSAGAATAFSWGTRSNPYIAGADLIGTFTGIDSPSTIMNSSFESIVVTTEGLITGESGGMANLHQKQLNGDWGSVFREAAEAGDFWADNGIGGGLGMFWDAVTDSF